jgi:hypothetical protein
VKHLVFSGSYEADGLWDFASGEKLHDRAGISEARGFFFTASPMPKRSINFWFSTLSRITGAVAKVRDILSPVSCWKASAVPSSPL